MKPYPLDLVNILNKHTRVGKIKNIIQQTKLEHKETTKLGLLNYVAEEYNSQGLGILDHQEYETALEFSELKNGRTRYAG